jgi:hypothetical protein
VASAKAWMRTLQKNKKDLYPVIKFFIAFVLSSFLLPVGVILSPPTWRVRGSRIRFYRHAAGGGRFVKKVFSSDLGRLCKRKSEVERDVKNQKNQELPTPNQIQIKFTTCFITLKKRGPFSFFYFLLSFN